METSKRPKVGFSLLGRASFDAHQLLECKLSILTSRLENTFKG